MQSNCEINQTEHNKQDNSRNNNKLNLAIQQFDELILAIGCFSSNIKNGIKWNLMKVFNAAQIMKKIAESIKPANKLRQNQNWLKMNDQ